MNRRTVFGLMAAVSLFGMTSGTQAADPPIKIGMSMAQTGGHGAGGEG